MCAGIRPCALRAVGQLLGFRATRPKTSYWCLPRLASSSSSQAWLQRVLGALPHLCAWLLPFSQPAPCACAFFSKIVCQSFPSCFLAQLPGDPKNAPWGPRHIAFLGNLPGTIAPKCPAGEPGNVFCGPQPIAASRAIPLKRWVLRTRPLRGQSRYHPNFFGHSPKPKIRLANF
jgi:hypothetical protein